MWCGTTILNGVKWKAYTKQLLLNMKLNEGKNNNKLQYNTINYVFNNCCDKIFNYMQLCLNR